jgi:hypothetical protein
MLFKEMMSVYCENHSKAINTLSGRNAELLVVKAGGTVCYHRAMNVSSRTSYSRGRNAAGRHREQARTVLLVLNRFNKILS